MRAQNETERAGFLQMTANKNSTATTWAERFGFQRLCRLPLLRYQGLAKTAPAKPIFEIDSGFSLLTCAFERPVFIKLDSMIRDVPLHLNDDAMPLSSLLKPAVVASRAVWITTSRLGGEELCNSSSATSVA
jgi:hypothetical protein